MCKLFIAVYLSIIFIGMCGCGKDSKTVTTPSCEIAKPTPPPPPKKEPQSPVFFDTMYDDMAFDTTIPFRDYIGKLVKEIEGHKWSDISYKFKAFGTASLEDADIILIGNDHSDYKVHIDIDILVNELLNDDNTIVLREGDQFDPIDMYFCTRAILGEIPAAYRLRQYSLSERYPVLNAGDFLAEIDRSWRKAFNIYEKVPDPIYKSLNLNKKKCSYWDDFRALNVDHDLIKRNQSMVVAIDYYRQKGLRVVVLAGLGHFPNYESTHDKNLTETKDIANYLKDKKYIDFIKLIYIE